MTYLQGDVLTLTGIALEADNDILPRAALRQVKDIQFGEGGLVGRVGTYAYCHLT